MKKILFALVCCSLLPLGSAVLFETPASMKALLIKGKRESISRYEVPVTPRQRLKLTIRARSVRGNNLATCPDQEQFLGNAVWGNGFFTRPFPRVGFEFRTADGKVRKNELYSPKRILVPRTEFADYVLEFYVPDGAAKLRVAVSPNGKENWVEIASFRVETVENASTLNVNPDFKAYGPNPSGWYCHDAAWGQDAKGKVSIQIGWAVGDYIPVTPGDRFSVRYGGANGGKHPQAFGVTFYKNTAHGAKNALGHNKIPMRLNSRGEGAIEISVPPNAAWMRLGARAGCISFVFVEKKK